ncbi:carotenoid oxygenase family protein [Roseomonas aeriglobus]|nr:carotenoid oxygenase family protein [Roseomonas aeriglobus]
MTFDPARRAFLGQATVAAGATVAASLLTPERALAAAMPVDWHLGFADVEADLAPRPLALVRGKAPAGLAGRLYRNGPAKFRRGTSAAGHWFDGDGFIRRFALRDGTVELSARFVDTPKRRMEAAANAMIVPGFGTPAGAGVALSNNDDASAANTSVMMAGEELWALWEAGSPMRVDPDTLATRGTRTLGEGLAHMPFLAHPRFDSDGRVWNLGQSGKRAIVWQLAGDGTLIEATPIGLPRASYIHDFTATSRHLVIVLQPWVHDRDVFPIVDAMTWRPVLGTQVLVLDKSDLTRRRTFELPAFSFFHLGDAWEDSDGTIRFDACIERDPTFAANAARALIAGNRTASPLPLLAMIALHPNGRGELIPTRVAAEFPKSDPRRAGSSRRYTIHTGLYDTGPVARGLGVFDWKTGRDASFDFGAHQMVEEFLFVASGAGESDGWLVGTTLNLARRASELHVFRAADITAGPVATWRADTALPIGFHGMFVS